MVDINDLALYGADIIRGVMYAEAPYDKGNLRDNGLGLAESVDSRCAQIVINRGNAAPYAIILDEAMYITNHRSRKSYRNKHYDWVFRGALNGAAALAAALGGTVSY